VTGEQILRHLHKQFAYVQMFKSGLGAWYIRVADPWDGVAHSEYGMGDTPRLAILAVNDRVELAKLNREPMKP
jgi:hypothetical protein